MLKSELLRKVKKNIDSEDKWCKFLLSDQHYLHPTMETRGRFPGERFCVLGSLNYVLNGNPVNWDHDNLVSRKEREWFNEYFRKKYKMEPYQYNNTRSHEELMNVLDIMISEVEECEREHKVA